MSRTLLNFLLDLLLLAIFVGLVWTSCIVRFVFPPGTAADGWTLWGLGYDDWVNIQFNILCVILLAVLVHVMLHWNWVCCVVATRVFRRKGAANRPDDGTQTLYGVTALMAILLLLGALLLAARLGLVSPAA